MIRNDKSEKFVRTSIILNGGKFIFLNVDHSSLQSSTVPFIWHHDLSLRFHDKRTATDTGRPHDYIVIQESPFNMNVKRCSFYYNTHYALQSNSEEEVKYCQVFAFS